jgi:hypothetical protein
MIRLALRTLVVLFAIAIVAAVVYLVVLAVAGPQPGAAIEYIGKLILIGFIAFLGRRFLKLRL